MAVSETTLIDAGLRVGLLTADSLNELRLQAKRERLRLLEMVTRAGRFPAAALYRALADVRGIPFLQPSELKADTHAAGLLSGRILLQRLMLPVQGMDGAKLLAVADPDDLLSLDRVERATDSKYRLALADPEVLRAAIIRVCEDIRPGSGQVEQAANNDPVRLLDDLMKEAYLRRASDIHFEPREGGMRIRMRIDGRMQEYLRLSTAADEEALINRIKVLSGLDIAEQRMPQDGAMKYSVMGWDVPETDIRVATCPTRWGERGTLRILGEKTRQLSLEDLGMPGEVLDEFRRAIGRSYGMILVTGPTGSGKSTTLYAALRELRLDEINVLTVEDPVEQTIEGISQVQVSSKVDFASALRSFLRHDPDVILVGEIRDRETLDIGLRAAMTGHLVLSTLHTNDSVGAVTRLVDIGAERFLIGATLIGVLAQRLARRLCPHCRRKRPARPDELELLGYREDKDIEICEPAGCAFCLGSGFRGRTGIFEALWINRDLRQAIAEGSGEREICEKAIHYRTLWQDCCRKVLDGDIALSEVLHLRPEV
jgi:type II secretory ATPase GspE/PulE/Tfp pilus assembly ATPase PilB-like protein